MDTFKAFERKLTDWIGLEEQFDFTDGPLELQAVDGFTIWLIGDADRCQITLTCSVSLTQDVTQDLIVFLLRQNNPDVNQTGIVMGVDRDTRLVSISRRFDVGCLDLEAFGRCVTSMPQLAKAIATAGARLDPAPLQLVFDDYTSATPRTKDHKFSALAAKLSTTDFALKLVTDNVGYIALTDASLRCMAVGDELQVTAISSDQTNPEADATLLEQMARDNLFLCKCQGSGHFLNDDDYPGSFAYIAFPDDAEQGFSAVAASVVGNLLNLMDRAKTSHELPQLNAADAYRIKI